MKCAAAQERRPKNLEGSKCRQNPHDKGKIRVSHPWNDVCEFDNLTGAHELPHDIASVLTTRQPTPFAGGA